MRLSLRAIWIIDAEAESCLFFRRFPTVERKDVYFKGKNYLEIPEVKEVVKLFKEHCLQLCAFPYVSFAGCPKLENAVCIYKNQAFFLALPSEETIVSGCSLTLTLGFLEELARAAQLHAPNNEASKLFALNSFILQAIPFGSPLALTSPDQVDQLMRYSFTDPDVLSHEPTVQERRPVWRPRLQTPTTPSDKGPTATPAKAALPHNPFATTPSLAGFPPLTFSSKVVVKFAEKMSGVRWSGARKQRGDGVALQSETAPGVGQEGKEEGEETAKLETTKEEEEEEEEEDDNAEEEEDDNDEEEEEEQKVESGLNSMPITGVLSVEGDPGEETNGFIYFDVKIPPELPLETARDCFALQRFVQMIPQKDPHTLCFAAHLPHPPASKEVILATYTVPPAALPAPPLQAIYQTARGGPVTLDVLIQLKLPQALAATLTSLRLTLPFLSPSHPAYASHFFDFAFSRAPHSSAHAHWPDVVSAEAKVGTVSVSQSKHSVAWSIPCGQSEYTLKAAITFANILDDSLFSQDLQCLINGSVSGGHFSAFTAHSEHPAIGSLSSAEISQFRVFAYRSLS